MACSFFGGLKGARNVFKVWEVFYIIEYFKMRENGR